MDEKLKETARCVVCHSPLADHFDSRNAWVGCNKEMVMKQRGQVLFVPVMIFGAPETSTNGKEVKAVHGAALATPATAHERQSSRGVMKMETPGTERSTSHRGRTAGLFLAGAKEPKKVTKSIQAVYDALVKSKTKGIAMKAIAEKLNMPAGTVGWALRMLRQQDALSYKPF
jgi:hypothetical protein